MPWGIQRLNAKKSQPNANIVFIKPLPGPNEKDALGFLERIAAQCVPVMRKHHLHVMSLEEYEPNREFVGRNFNAGEVIQLVLKSARTGRWLPFEYVQMVMMHELAHCKQMNHSRAFWAIRNGYAADMYKLWGDGYTGEGIWGRGANLGTGEWERNVVREDELLPEHLCGGTFRSRARKRKTKPTLSYQERKERRILNKFGKNGVALGADEETRVKLERGKRVQARPRVAGSARGRELRAAAALARFEQREEEGKLQAEEEADSGSESDYYGDADGRDVEPENAFHVDGKGIGMVKVCESEDADDAEARNELDDLRDVFQKRRIQSEWSAPLRLDGQVTNGPHDAQLQKRREDQVDNQTAAKSEQRGDSLDPKAAPKAPIRPESRRPAGASHREPGRDIATCPMCSFANAPLAVTCSMCANVLDPASTPGTWRCRSSACVDGSYVNSGDCSMCGLCGRRRM